MSAPLISRSRLRRVAGDFRTQLAGANPAAGVTPLLDHLISVERLECARVDGFVSGHAHSWVELADGTTVDLSADQFLHPSGRPMPPVYVGVRPAWYRVGSWR
jgi:hypothetical protein